MNSENYFKNQRRTSSRLCCMFHGTPCMILQLRKKKNNRKYLKSPSTFHFFYRTFYCQILDNFCVGYRSAETTVFYFQPPPHPIFPACHITTHVNTGLTPPPPINPGLQIVTMQALQTCRLQKPNRNLFSLVSQSLSAIPCSLKTSISTLICTTCLYSFHLLDPYFLL